ncbi:MAG TPA: hypothetical protein VK766_08720 [Cytophagaceae bacterium]|nr:hypothetical protein [Cytophagaceae bacterium]
MKVAGFSFIRNAVKYDYPIVEAISSILPVCDVFIIAIGNSEDGTEELIKNINSDKIKIISTVWNDQLREGGKVLADETNKAFDAIEKEYDWCFYIQGDEVMHEKYLPIVASEMQKYVNDNEVEGLLVNYKHFYGSYDYVGVSRKWYRKEIRIIKNDKNIRSYKDAQGFRLNGRKLRVKEINAEIFHYGWVRNPKAQQLKQETFHKLWHDDDWVKKNVIEADEFDYKTVETLSLFKDTHPLYMEERLKNAKWNFNYDPTKSKKTLKEKISFLIENITGYRIGEYKNYKKI